MNKTELYLKVAEMTGMERQQAEKAVGATLTAITEAMKAGDKVQLMGFGTFEVRARAAHTGRNPATGETIEVAASKTPVFRAGKALKDGVNE